MAVAARRPLTAKLLPPEPPEGLVRRDELLGRLDRTFHCRLTTVVAAAGYGKSTLVASWARAPACVWLTCDRSDRSLGTFARGLAEAVRPRRAALSERLAAIATGSDEPGRADAVAAFVCRALEEELADDLVLVVDDVHELGRTSPSGRLLAALCRQAPLGFHLVLCSRTQPPFSVERLRGRAELVEIGAEDLRFTQEEVEELLVGLVGERDEAVGERLHALTRGWPAAVRLTIESIRGAEDRAAAIDSLRSLDSPLFGYVTREVLAAQPPSVRDLLRAVTPFDRFDAAFCEAIGIPRAAERLRAAAERGLIIPLGRGPERSFAVHELVGEAVAAAWPLEPSEVRALRRRAAPWLERRGLYDEALRELIALGDETAVAGFLDRQGGELLSLGAASTVVTAAELVPERLRTPGLEQLVGRAHYLLGDWAQALAHYERVAPGRGRVPAGVAWRMSDVLHVLGRFDESSRVLERVVLDGRDPADEAAVVAKRAYAAWLAGNTATAEELAPRALELAAPVGGEALVTASQVAAAIATMIEGRHDEAMVHLSRAVEEAERCGDLLLEARSLEELADPLLSTGRNEEALDHQTRAIELADAAGFTFMKAQALQSRAHAHLDLGRLDDAFADADAATKIFRAIDSPWVCVSLTALGCALRARGELALARAALEEAVRLAEGAGESPILIRARSELARVLAAEEPERAATLAGQALAQAAPPGSLYAVVTLGWLALHRGDRTAALSFARRASQAARARAEQAALAESLELTAFASPDPSAERALLEEAAGIWRRLGNPVAATRTEYAIARLGHARPDAERAKRKLSRLGVRVESAARSAGLLMALGEEVDEPVRIQTLGGFRVLREGRAVPLTEWQSKKARDLLKILVTRRGRPTPRDVLKDVLWGDDDPQRVAKRLAVALSTIRAVLDPGRRFPPDHFVVADADAVAVVSEHVEVDVELFLADASRGLSALREGRDADALELLESAEAAYPGEYLEEDLYEDWASPLREEARAAYVATVRALALEATGCGDNDAAVRYRLRLVQHDPYDEEAHLGLVAALSGSGRHGDARRAYHEYVGRMDEIGVEPAPFPTGRRRPP